MGLQTLLRSQIGPDPGSCLPVVLARAQCHRRVSVWKNKQRQPLRRQSAGCTAAHDGAYALVSSILEDIEDTDGGLNMPDEKRQKVNERIQDLSTIGAEQQPRPLSNPLVFGNYDVAYVSAGTQQYGAPAGGKFRGRLGRALFRTSAVCQSVLGPDLVINKVSFKLLGLLAGHVGLRGRLQAVGDSGDTARVQFEPPELSLGSALSLRIGPPSSVQLTTTYLDDRVRLGVGSRGSLFVFTRGGASDREEMDKVGTGRTTSAGVLTLSALLAGTAAAATALWRTSSLAGRTCSATVFALLFAICLLIWRGGLARDYERAVKT